MPAVAIQKNKVENAYNVFQQLSEKEKMAFYEKTKRQFALMRAKKLDSVLPANDMTMAEIVAETKAMRSERNAKN